MATAEVANPRLEKSDDCAQEVCKFYLNGRCRFSSQCRNIHPELPNCESPVGSPKTSSPKERDRKICAKSNDEKKPSMKTSDNVIKRILWDESLPSEKYTIGYLDRFLGIIEKPFEAFSWEHPAAVDNTVLAIPKHRIQYFKYRGIKVWDKNERLDNVFGSIGAKKNIYAVMEDIDELKTKEPTQEDEENQNELKEEIDQNERLSMKHRSKKFTRAKAPTHFVSIKITDRIIMDKIANVQKHIVRHEPCYADYLIPVNDLHITLCLLNLDNVGAIYDSTEVLKDIAEKLNGSPYMKLNIEGLDMFYRHILFAKVKPENDLFSKFVSNVQDELRNTSGIDMVRDDHDFTPHVTVMKTSKLLPDEKRYIDPLLIRRNCNDSFGIVTVNNLELCSMPANEDGLHESVKTYEIKSTVEGSTD